MAMTPNEIKERVNISYGLMLDALGTFKSLQREITDDTMVERLKEIEKMFQEAYLTQGEALSGCNQLILTLLEEKGNTLADRLRDMQASLKQR